MCIIELRLTKLRDDGLSGRNIKRTLTIAWNKVSLLFIAKFHWQLVPNTARNNNTASDKEKNRLATSFDKPKVWIKNQWSRKISLQSVAGAKWVPTNMLSSSRMTNNTIGCMSWKQIIKTEKTKLKLFPWAFIDRKNSFLWRKLTDGDR